MIQPGSIVTHADPDRIYEVVSIDDGRFAYKRNPRVKVLSFQSGNTLRRFRRNSLTEWEPSA